MTEDHRSSPDDPPVDEVKRLPKDIPADPGLELRIVADLGRRGLIAARGSRRPSRWVSVAASLLVAFAVGWLARGGWQPSGSPPKARFVLLLFGEPSAGSTREEDRVQEYRAWARRTAAAGRAVSGERLAAPFGTAGDPAAGSCGGALRGFFLIEAKSEEEALTLARDHPHVRHGGTIVVRPVDPT